MREKHVVEAQEQENDLYNGGETTDTFCNFSSPCALINKIIIYSSPPLGYYTLIFCCSIFLFA